MSAGSKRKREEIAPPELEKIDKKSRTNKDSTSLVSKSRRQIRCEQLLDWLRVFLYSDVISIIIAYDVTFLFENVLVLGGKESSKDGEFDQPRFTTIEGNELFVVDRCNHRIQIFDLTTGHFLRKLGTPYYLNLPYGVLVHENEVYVFNSDHHPDRDVKGWSYLPIFDRQTGRYKGGFNDPKLWSAYDVSCAIYNNQLFVGNRREHNILIFDVQSRALKEIWNDKKYEIWDPREICIYGDEIFVLSSGRIISIDLKTKERLHKSECFDGNNMIVLEKEILLFKDVVVERPKTKESYDQRDMIILERKTGSKLQVVDMKDHVGSFSHVAHHKDRLYFTRSRDHAQRFDCIDDHSIQVFE